MLVHRRAVRAISPDACGAEQLHQRLPGSQSLKCLLPNPYRMSLPTLSYPIMPEVEVVGLESSKAKQPGARLHCTSLFHLCHHHHVTVPLKPVSTHFSGPRALQSLPPQICPLLAPRNNHLSSHTRPAHQAPLTATSSFLRILWLSRMKM